MGEIDEPRVYAPNSIYHDVLLTPKFGCKGLDDKTLLRIERDRLIDFIEFLFDHSEHCDHISQSEAWEEFEVYEATEASKWRLSSPRKKDE